MVNALTILIAMNLHEKILLSYNRTMSYVAVALFFLFLFFFFCHGLNVVIKQPKAQGDDIEDKDKKEMEK